MHVIIEKLFKKRGIKDISELSEDEKKTFDGWNKVLSEGEVTVEKIEKFCASQIGLIEAQWKNLDNEARKNERLLTMHVVYSAIKNAISGPQKRKEELEKELNKLIHV